MQETTNLPPDELQQAESQKGVEAAPSTPARFRFAVSDVFSGLAVNIVFSMLAALITVVGYQYFLAPKTPQLATVDIMKIMESADAPALRAIRDGDLEAAKKAAADRAQIAVKLETVLDGLSKKQNMVFIQKQALIGSGVPDFTEEVMKIMGTVQ